MTVKKAVVAFVALGVLFAGAAAGATELPPPPAKPEMMIAAADEVAADAGADSGIAKPPRPGTLARPEADAAEIIPVPVRDVAPDAVPVRAGDGVPRGVLTVTVGKTRPLRLDAQVADVIVGNPGVAEVMVGTRERVYIAGRQVGTTNVYFLDAEGRVIREAEVAVEIDVQAVQRALGRLLPEEQISAGVVNGSLVLSGTASTQEAADKALAVAQQFVEDERVLNMLTLSGQQQVMLRVRVAEVSRDISKQLSAQTSYEFDIGDYVADFNNIGDLAPLGLSSAGQINISGPGPFSFVMQALEDENLASTLAEPNLTAVSGGTASMLAGGEIPVPTEIQDNEIVYEWRPFGVSLDFTPVVLGPGRISLAMQVEVSAIAGSRQIGLLDVPEFSVRRASSSVELPSGGSIMIGGLLREDVRQAAAGFPGVKDLPILGALFRSSGFISNETELVFTVTAYIVRPVEQRNLAVPTDGFVPANDLDRYLLGRLTASYSDVNLDDFAGGMPVKGPIGYIVE